MIERHWGGLAKPEQAQSYIAHLREETFPALAKIPGFVDASILTRRVERGVEFLVATRWTSMEAIERFAGRYTDAAVVPERVQQMMIEYDRSVRHYEMEALDDR